MSEIETYLAFRKRTFEYGLNLKPARMSPEEHVLNSKPIERALAKSLREFPALFDSDLMKVLMYNERTIGKISIGNFYEAYQGISHNFGPSTPKAIFIRKYLNLIATSNEHGIKRDKLKNILRRLFNVDEDLGIKVSNLETFGVGFHQSESHIFYLDMDKLDLVIRLRYSPSVMIFRENDLNPEVESK